MQRAGQIFPLQFISSLLLVFLGYSCANESSQNSSPRQRTVVESGSNSSESKEANKATQEEETGSKQYENPLDNRESSSSKQARLEREAQACLEEDEIKKVEVVVSGEALEPIDITTLYKSGTIFDDAIKVAKRGEPEIDPPAPGEPAPTPPKEESTTEDGIKVTLYKMPNAFAQVPTEVPAPTFKFSLTGASGDNGIKVDLDEAIYPLLNSFAQSVDIPYDDGDLGISELSKVAISIKRNIFQISTPFLTPNSPPLKEGEDPDIKIEELYPRQILKLALKVNGKKIYEVEDLNHVISFHDGGDSKLAYKPEWTDLKLSENKHMQQYLDDFKKCTAPLDN